MTRAMQGKTESARTRARCGSPGTVRAPDPDALAWQAEMPLVTNPLAMFDVVKMFGAGALFPLFLLVALAFWEGSYEGIPFAARISLFLFGGLLAAGVLVMLVVFGNRMPYEYRLDREGAWMASTSVRGRRLSNLAIAIGLLAGPRGFMAVGSGLLAKANAAAFLPWKDLGGARFYPGSHRIALMNDWRRVLLLEIPPALYPEVAARVRGQAARVRDLAAGQPRPATAPAIRAWLSLFVVLFTVALLGDAKPLDVSPGVALVNGVLALAALWTKRWISLGLAGLLVTLVIGFNAYAWLGGQFDHLGKADWRVALVTQMVLTAFFVVLGLMILLGFVRSQRAV